MLPIDNCEEESENCTEATEVVTVAQKKHAAYMKVCIDSWSTLHYELLYFYHYIAHLHHISQQHFHFIDYHQLTEKHDSCDPNFYQIAEILKNHRQY